MRSVGLKYIVGFTNSTKAIAAYKFFIQFSIFAMRSVGLKYIVGFTNSTKAIAAYIN